MKCRYAGAVFALWLLAGAEFCDASQAEVRHDPGKSPEAGSNAAWDQRPDWSGAWSTFFGPLEAKQALEKVLKPDPLVQFNEMFRRYISAELNLRALYCAPYLFGGFSEGAEGDIEFLFTPGRVTLLWEGGLVRRIYLEPRVIAEDDPETSSSGTSVGHWEGDTLVVSTALHASAGPFLGYLNAPGYEVGENARLTERIHLKDADTLQMDLALDAPALLTSPAKLTVLYRRDRHYRMGDYTRCPKLDRSIDDESGLLKHDRTPPADLPPPPSS